MTTSERLAEPFDPGEVKWKPQAVKGNRCLAIAYIDARVVQDRLDEVMGVENWQDTYTVLNDGSVVCHLALKFPGAAEWITKEDVGSPSEQPDGGDRLKAAFSDALKRAAVKFGVGRYLYRLAAHWVDYDEKTKKPAKVPQLPAWALPAGKKQPGSAATEARVSTPPATEGGVSAAPPAPARIDGELVATWKGWIERTTDIGTFNNNWRQLKEVKDGATQKHIWELIMEETRERGWGWDAEKKLFTLADAANTDADVV